jgi:hypothetical protein
MLDEAALGKTEWPPERGLSGHRAPFFPQH